MKVVMLSGLRTGRIYPPGNFPGTHFCQRLSRPQGRSAAGRIMSMKISNNTIGNRSSDLPACSAVPQPTAPPHMQSSSLLYIIYIMVYILCIYIYIYSNKLLDCTCVLSLRKPINFFKVSQTNFRNPSARTLTIQRDVINSNFIFGNKIRLIKFVQTSRLTL